MNVSESTLDKLDFWRICEALAERASTPLGAECASGLRPTLSLEQLELAWQRTEEMAQISLSLGGVSDIRPLLGRAREAEFLDGQELLQIAYTMDAAATIKRAILSQERPALSDIANQMRSFDGVLRLVREQLDLDGRVRDDASPKLRDIRRRLRPLRDRIRERLNQLLSSYSTYIRDPLITLRRERYVIPVISSFQSKVPGIALDSSDSGQTIFIEPQSVVPLNNELAILEFEERDEVRRILISLAQQLAFHEGLDETLEQLATLDLVQASSRLAKDWRLSKPELNDRNLIKLEQARHPLIADCVPNTLKLTADQQVLIITGPNAGGKTVLLKTLGLAVLMAQSGLFVAAEAPSLPEFRALLSDIGDEQSIEASLSTYAGHLKNLKEIVERASPEVLVLIDELGSGTDPSEGAALSQAILERLLQQRAPALVTTHLAPLKVFASETAGIQNAAMRFDLERLRPTYQLSLGQPGRSYALAIAERVGLSADILSRASELLGPEGERLEHLLETLEQQRLKLEQDVLGAETARDDARREAEVLRQQIQMLRDKEAAVLAIASEKAEEMLQDTLQRAKELKRTASSDPEARPQALAELQALRKTVRQHVPKTQTSTAGLQVGSMVHVKDYDAEGPISEIRSDTVMVQLGLLKVEVPKKAVSLKKVKTKPAKSQTSSYATAGFQTELNIRGERVEEGLEKIREFILEAQALKTPSVRILHGKGTGALRDAVRNYLKDEKRVLRYEDAVPYEGGHGVTVVYLKL